MLKIKKIAVTGGLAAGKTTVCQIFKELGAYVVSADEIVHQLLSPGTAVGQQVVKLLGSDIMSGQDFDRRKIAAKVFSQPSLLRTLEAIIHPAVFNEVERKYQQVSREKKHPLFVAEIPLLFEAGEQSTFDAVVTVQADKELCKKRFVQQTQQPIDEFEKRMTRQMTPLEKASQAQYNIDNNGDLEQLKIQVKTIYSLLTEEYYSQ
jgi:dephospho-CoA kinase